jgi:hypothetical protein
MQNFVLFLICVLVVVVVAATYRQWLIRRALGAKRRLDAENECLRKFSDDIRALPPGDFRYELLKEQALRWQERYNRKCNRYNEELEELRKTARR